MSVFLLSGKKYSGKNTVGGLLKKYFFDYGDQVKEYAYADNLKKFCIDVLGLSRGQVYGNEKESITGYKWTDLSADVYARYKDEVEENGYEFMTARQVMQVVGTDLLRDKFYGKIWSDALIRQIHNDNHKIAIVTDLRFINEINGAREYGKKYSREIYVLNIVRPSLNSIDSHNSENELNMYNEFDGIIANSGTIDDLWSELTKVLANFGVY
jgi:hypothetical protein